MQTILGASGTIGCLLAKELSAYTDKIRLVSRHPKKVNPTDELFPADLTDPAQVDKAIAGSKIVYLVVGFEYKYKVWATCWPALMKAVITSCHHHQAKLVFFDNVYMYAKTAIPFMTEASEQNPPSRKGQVRKLIADMVLDAIQTEKIDALIARSADFYGPGNKSSLLYIMVLANLLKGKSASWVMNDHKIHSFTFTPDAAKGTAMLGNTPAAFNQVWHLPTSGELLTGKKFVEMFSREMNLPNKISVIPKWVMYLLGLFIPIMRELPEMMYQYDQDYLFDSSRFETTFNFNPTNYEEGIKQMIAAGR